MKKEFNVTGMSCQNCVSHVEKGVASLSGVAKVKVNLKKGRAIVKYDDSVISDSEIIAKIKDVGYEATEA